MACGNEARCSSCRTVILRTDGAVVVAGKGVAWLVAGGTAYSPWFMAATPVEAPVAIMLGRDR